MLRGCLSVAPYYVTYRTAQTYRGAHSSLRECESVAERAFSERMSGGYRVDRWEIQCEHRNTKNRLSNYSAGGFLFILFGA